MQRPATSLGPVRERPPPAPFSWSFPADLDLRSIGLFRIVLGLNLVYDLLWRKLPYVPAFYSDQGVVPRYFVRNLYGWRGSSLFDLLGGDLAVYAFFGLTVVLYLLFTVGIKPRIVGALAYLCLWSIHQRNPFVIYGVDYICNALLFWSLFLPLDARFALGARRHADRSLDVPKLATLGILLQISFIYLGSGLSKDGATWRDGTAIAVALADSISASAGADWLLSHPGMCRALTWATLGFEWFVIVLILSPWKPAVTRSVAAAAILAFNGGIAPFIYLGPFWFTALAQVAVLIPGALWDRLGIGGPSRAPSRLARPATTALLVASLVGLVWSNLYPLAQQGWLAGTLQRSSLARRLWPEAYPGWEYSSILCQDWSFFAPDPGREAGWIVVVGELGTGGRLALPEGRPLDWRPGPEGSVEGDPREVFAGDSRGSRRPRPSRATLASGGTWRDFESYARTFHGRPDWRRLLDSWASWERERWNRREPTRPLGAVELVLVSIDAYEVAAGRPPEPRLWLLHRVE
jgi:hypothetical protein